MRTICCTSSVADGATAADAMRSSGSLRNGEYASRYRSRSSSEVNTHGGPTAFWNSAIALAKSLWLTPGGTLIVRLLAVLCEYPRYESRIRRHRQSGLNTTDDRPHTACARGRTGAPVLGAHNDAHPMIFGQLLQAEKRAQGGHACDRAPVPRPSQPKVIDPQGRHVPSNPRRRPTGAYRRHCKGATGRETRVEDHLIERNRRGWERSLRGKTRRDGGAQNAELATIHGSPAGLVCRP